MLSVWISHSVDKLELQAFYKKQIMEHHLLCTITIFLIGKLAKITIVLCYVCTLCWFPGQ